MTVKYLGTLDRGALLYLVQIYLKSPGPSLHTFSVVHIDVIALELREVSGLQISIFQRTGSVLTGKGLPPTVQLLRRARRLACVIFS